MLSEIQYMEKGDVYCIKNRKNGLYLTAGNEVACAPRVVGKISQYWLCEQVKPTMYEIISLQSGSVLTRNQGLTIQKGKWYSNQFWGLCRAQITKKNNYFWITASDNDQKYLFGYSTSDKVAMKSMDKTLYVSNWIFQRINDTQQLAGCCVFKSQFSNMVLDVPQGSSKDGVSIIQYAFNGRGNQRWVLQSLKDQFIIRNICSNMILCPQNRIVKQGTKIIQSQFTNNIAEKWVIVKSSKSNQNINLYILCNSADPTLLLGVTSNKQSSGLILSTEKQKCLWNLQGNVPQVLQAKNQQQINDQKIKQ